MIDKRVYWIWLQQALKYGNYKIKNICDIYKNDIESFFKDGERNWRLCGFFTNNDIHALNSSSISEAQSIFDQCYRLSYDVVTPSDELYPENLYNIANPPAVLYVLGDKSVLQHKINIAVVGTRSASISGLRTADELSYQIATYGGIVVSGGASGIDTAAHKGALRANKPTIAVLGCGINFNYLSQNSGLRYQISKNGALVSEYPPDYPAHNYNFPMRNRIISGLSVATIVVEAGKKSGSLITANLANDQGRDVFVVPTDINGSLCSGALALVKDGAKVATHVEPLVENYKNKYNFSSKITRRYYDNSDTNNFSGQKNIQLHIDDIGNLLNLEPKFVLTAITVLEIHKLIRNCPGNFCEIL